VLYVAVYASQAAVGVALGTESSLQLPGLLIVMFAGVIALPRAVDTWINVPLAALSLPIVLPPAPTLADVVYVIAHFATVSALVGAACALMERAAAQGFAYRLRLQREASTDALTGALNRRAFEACVVRELERAHRTGLPLALAIIDIDHFKRVNDGHGHDTGDRLLSAVAQTLQAHVRRSDLLARIGGEEFALVMLDAPAPAHLLMLERLRHAARALQVPAGDGASIGCTVSIGVAARTPADTDWSALHKRADQALYAAKAACRDRVVDAANLAPASA
jgi:two-component system cell cycle response regulator